MFNRALHDALNKPLTHDNLHLTSPTSSQPQPESRIFRPNTQGDALLEHLIRKDLCNAFPCLHRYELFHVLNSHEPVMSVFRIKRLRSVLPRQWVWKAYFLGECVFLV